ncbi:MAG: LPS export ABC transporter ATP-binding protein [Magnetococcales bacterium]|nr:LPS export ABC transporter ATP-binding protein [Magnetococcales bacterium]
MAEAETASPDTDSLPHDSETATDPGLRISIGQEFDDQEEPFCLSARGICKSFDGRSVVNDVSISVSTGEVVGLLGPNGAGKTTSFYILVGLIAPDDGQILMRGEDVTEHPMYMRARNGLSYLPQEPSVFRRMTVRDNVLAILETLPLTRRQRMRRLEELLVELGIIHLSRTMGYALSGGERRRVEVARALAIDPRFILLDEPFAGVDPLAVGDIQSIIRHLKNRGIGILITDHNVRETLGICDRAYILSQGQVLAKGSPNQVVTNANVLKMYLGEEFKM